MVIISGVPIFRIFTVKAHDLIYDMICMREKSKIFTAITVPSLQFCNDLLIQIMNCSSATSKKENTTYALPKKATSNQKARPCTKPDCCIQNSNGISIT